MSIVPPEDEYWLNIAQPVPPRAGSPFARIAAEHKRLIREARLNALREAREMLEAERNAMSSRQAAFERMGNDDAVRDLSKDIADQTRRIYAIGQMEEESR
jgi:hypothetical protein